MFFEKSWTTQSFEKKFEFEEIYFRYKIFDFFFRIKKSFFENQAFEKEFRKNVEI